MFSYDHLSNRDIISIENNYFVRERQNNESEWRLRNVKDLNQKAE